MNENLHSDIREHNIFDQLTKYGNFYKDLSLAIFHWMGQGTKAIINLDTYVYSSIQGTLESIKDILIKGHINDAYALLRKYYDSTIINIYTSLYLQDHFGLDNFIVEKIDGWRKGTEKIPSFRVMSEYVINSPKTTELTKIFYKDNQFRGSELDKLRGRCNEHLHYFYYRNLLANDPKIFSPKRLLMLDNLSKDLNSIFILHIAYIFYLNGHYMMASHYRDCLDLGIEPEEGSQYLVANFVQDIFDQVIKRDRLDVFEAIKSVTKMDLK
ncbi:hypothetical protein EZV76_16715 [Flagellimonas alvinocaridis]|uniref:Uncharacterized protein n=1 Tax=Flagellimonas alvinocaridis TaxID=2530200 RepID=A0A4S8RF08_9FLAO|nr:hypothetical protein [Allomuricauda alvinocaridis]THV56797.1 hypothetical protein EZV76_16715 [Allomuricauda alvinocaridis]